MNLLSHPFRLTPDGTVATVEDGTEEATLEGIAVLALTRKGERDLAPGFGMTDPTFRDVDVAELNLGLHDYGPDVTITSATTEAVTDTLTRVVITFEE